MPFFGYFFHAVIETTEGGESMDDDIYVFEMFLQIMQLFEDDIPDSRMRVLSKNPRYQRNRIKVRIHPLPSAMW